MAVLVRIDSLASCNTLLTIIATEPHLRLCCNRTYSLTQSVVIRGTWSTGNHIEVGCIRILT